MSSMEVSMRIHRQSIHEAKGRKNYGLLCVMVLFGTVISGIIRKSAYPPDFLPNQSSEADMINGTNARRYCQPPNATILSLYEMYYDSEEDNTDESYDFSQMEEMDFQIVFPQSQKDAHWQWQAFLWGSLFSSIPAALLSECFGPGRVFGFSLLSCGAFGLFVPSQGLSIKAIITFLQGAFYGFLEPCALMLAVSVAEEKKLLFLSFIAGNKLGIGAGELIASHLRAFTACILAVTWFATWVLMLDTPLLPQKKTAVPWRKMISSRVLWMSSVAVFGTELLQEATLYTLRQYLHIVYYFSNRYILALPHFLTFLVAVISAILASIIERNELVSRTTNRRMFVYVSHFLPSAMLFVSGFVGCDETAPVSLFALSTAFSGAAYAGAFASILDISKTFPAATVTFVCFCGSVGRVFPVLLTFLIFDGLMPGSWRLVLSLSSLITLVAAMFFMLRGSSRPPSYNYPDMPHFPRLPRRITLENCILRVLAVKETEKFTRVRACSTSVAGPARIIPLKRASIS